MNKYFYLAPAILAIPLFVVSEYNLANFFPWILFVGLSALFLTDNKLFKRTRVSFVALFLSVLGLVVMLLLEGLPGPFYSMLQYVPAAIFLVGGTALFILSAILNLFIKKKKSKM